MQNNNQTYENIPTDQSFQQQQGQQQFNAPPMQQQNGFNAPPGQQQNGFNAPPGQQQQVLYQPPMQNQQMPPQQGMQQNQQYQQSQMPPSVIDKLMLMGGVFIKQKINLIEDLTGCVQRNRYDVFSADSNGEQNSSLAFMTVKEESGCCMRQCVPSMCRGMELHMIFNMEAVAGSGQWVQQLGVKSKKQCTCTFFCCNRPEMEIVLTSPQGEQPIGTIKNPWYFCDLGVETHTPQKQHNNTIKGSCCQLGVLCPFPCRPCQEVDFDVINNRGEKMIPLKKKSPGLWRACLGSTDYFSVIFPADYSKEDRLLMIAGALMIDYMYFNDKPDKKKELDVVVTV